jgi:hypothetical protein
MAPIVPDVASPSYRDLFDVHSRYVDYLLARSHLSHGFLRDISQSGEDVEIDLRGLIRQVMPSRYKVTHGHIVRPSVDQMPVVSPQIDMIIVDTLVPHSVFGAGPHDGMEVVPIEAVVGIFEIKRTLTYDTVKAALDHLHRIARVLNIEKTDSRQMLPGGVCLSDSNSVGWTGGLSANPVFGIIGAQHDATLNDRFAEFSQYPHADGSGLVPPADIIGAFDGFIAGIKEATQDSLHIVFQRQADVSYVLSRFTQDLSNADSAGLLLGWITTYIQGICGRSVEASDYYLRPILAPLG